LKDEIFAKGPESRETKYPAGGGLQIPWRKMHAILNHFGWTRSSGVCKGVAAIRGHQPDAGEAQVLRPCPIGGNQDNSVIFLFLLKSPSSE
jgi:hypothetical protein